MGLNHTPKSKVNAVWIFRELSCSILIVSIYYVPKLDIRMKCYDHFNNSRASVVQFRVSRYIMGLNHTPESKVNAIWIYREVSCSFFIVSIYCAPESNIQGKSSDHLNYLRASIVRFWASRYIMGLNHTHELKLMVVWIGRKLPCSILSVSIYYAPELDIRVKSYEHFNYSRASIVQFRWSRCIIGLTHTPESKFMTI